MDKALDKALEIEKLTVQQGRLVVDVRLPRAQWRRSTPDLMRALMQTYPDLPYHACVNGVGDTFAVVMTDTDLAHVFEHVMISEMTRASEHADARFVGTTEWVDAQRGQARVQVSFESDLDALRAARNAADAINAACASAERSAERTGE